jgi:hypothetical protein
MKFSASLLFRAEHENDVPHETTLWQELIILIEAKDELQAEQKAANFGKAQQHDYKNEKEERVSWRFIQIERVCLIDAQVLEDGCELFSRFLRDSEVKSLLTPFQDSQ